MQISNGQDVRRERTAFYWQRTRWPLQCLFFLLPLLIVYELGALTYVPAGFESLPRVRAEQLLHWTFGQLGVSSLYLPPLVVVAVLVGWHLARQDPWRPELKLYLLMALEAFVWAAPLVMFSVVLFRDPAHNPVAPEATPQPDALMALVGGQIPSWRAGILIAIAAGLYEELVFRLFGIAIFHTLLKQALGLKPVHAAWGAIFLAALTFSLYHYGEAEFNLLQQLDAKMWAFLLFSTLAGIYFGAIFVLRGFGIVVATHALYDVVVISALFAG